MLKLRNPLQLVLLDRDGVINQDSDNYIKAPDEWVAIPGSIEAICALQQHVSVAVCTNQSGIGRGLFEESALFAMHEKMNALICNAGGEAVNVYYCPHLPDAGCQCRKPNPGLLLLAARDAGVAADASMYVGDSGKDLLAAQAAGMHSALVLTGKGNRTAQTSDAALAALTADNLHALCEHLQPERP